jgi:predicted CXXCH cytochrome family protein
MSYSLMAKGRIRSLGIFVAVAGAIAAAGWLCVLGSGTVGTPRGKATVRSTGGRIAKQSAIDDANPGDPRSLEQRTREFIQARKWDQAIAAAERLSGVEHYEARGSMMVGMIRTSLGDAPAASAAFRRAFAIDPSEVEHSSDPVSLRKLIARTWLRAEDPARARAILQPILNRGDDPEASWLSSRAYLQEHKEPEAARAIMASGRYRADHPLENEPGPYVGESRCEGCHQSIARDSQSSRHTQSYYRGDQLATLPLPDRPLPDPDNRAATHTFLREKGVIRQETAVGDQTVQAVVEYAFGTIDRYLTMVSRDDQAGYRIARLSHFDTPRGRGWDRSALDHLHPSGPNASDYLGELIGVRDGVPKCLYCHVTNPRASLENKGPEASDRAIGCERCHGPGGNHIAAVGLGLKDLAIVSPAVLSPATVTSGQCNDCHILGRDFAHGGADDPAWTRSQGVGWTRSRCNTESGGMFGCVTCHDPHKSARATTTEQYEARCLLCHGGSSEAAASPAARKVAKTSSSPCPVNAASGCIACHMPRVPIESLHLDLTDHHIRIYKPAK